MMATARGPQKQRRGRRMGMELGENLALHFLTESKTSTLDWEGRSEELAAHVAREAWHVGLEARVVWISAVRSNGPLSSLGDTLCPIWGGSTKYHVVCCIDGAVHDPWCSVVLPLVDWATVAFPGLPVTFETKTV